MANAHAPRQSSALLTPEHPRVARSQGKICRVQCGRCLNNMDIPTLRVRAHLKCSRCHRHVGLPKLIRHVCSYCGCHGEYALDTSGRRVPCRHCGMRIPIPVQVATPKKHRRHRRTSRRGTPRTTRGSSLLPLLFSLGVSVLGLMMCLKLLTNL